MISIEELRMACREAVAAGWKIRGRVYLAESHRCCCPLGALYVQKYGTRKHASVIDEVTHMSGMDWDERMLFTHSFDTGYVQMDCPPSVMGATLRKEFIDAGA